MLLNADKWRLDLLPAIQAGRYRDRLPSGGAGSRGGTTNEHLRILDGVPLRFMHGAGNDKRRSGFSARAVLITEVDGMDEIGATSREADPITQIEARTSAYGSRGLVFLECTVSTEKGRTWTEYKAGTESRWACPCVHCGAYVSPEREHLVGWEDAKSGPEAGVSARWACPSCAAELTEEDRQSMNQVGVLVHQGQTVDRRGRVRGEAKQTDTLSFRWNAWANLFWTTADVATREWKARQSDDDEAAERELRQFVWALPVQSEISHETPKGMILARVDPSLHVGAMRGGADLLVAGIDVGRHAMHWTLSAFEPDDTMNVIAYGVQDVPTRDMGEELAMESALAQLVDVLVATRDGKPVRPDLTLVDAGYRPETIQPACRAYEKVYPSKGYGHGQRSLRYATPAKRTGAILRVGDGWHLTRHRESGHHLVHFNADQAKTWLRSRIETPKDDVGSFRLFEGSVKQHHSFVHHLDSEKRITDYKPGTGRQEKWEQTRKANHWLDSTVLTVVGSRMVRSARAGARRRRRTSSPMREASGE